MMIRKIKLFLYTKWIKKECPRPCVGCRHFQDCWHDITD